MLKVLCFFLIRCPPSTPRMFFLSVLLLNGIVLDLEGWRVDI